METAGDLPWQLQRTATPAVRSPPIDRVGLAILLLATVIGLWLGLAGPGTSPVAPGGAPVLDVLLGAVGGGVGP
jgi:hypothetical protein